MILVWFVYGLAFFVLGLVILVYPKKDSKFDLAQCIWMVGFFGIIHGLNEWLDMFIRIGGPLPPERLAQVRMFVLPVSFFWLVQFGATLLARNARRRRLLSMIPALVAVGWLVALLLDESSRRPLVENIWSRYLLCVPGTLLTAWALLLEMRRFRALGLRSIAKDLALAAVTFVAYGICAGLIVRKADFFPASVLNYETFTSVTGVPVQIFRTICAVVAVGSIIRVLDLFRWESHEALRISEARCATIASAMPIVLFMTDPEMIVTFVQGRGLEVLGLRPAQILGRHIRAAFPCGPTLVDHCRQVLSGETFVATIPMNGVPFEICYSVLRDSAGAITSIVGVALDVGARMEAQRELEQIFYQLIQWSIDAADGRAEQKLTISCAVGERCIDLLFCDTCRAARAQQSGHALGQVLPDTDDVDGFGLGVAVVRQIVASHGGQMTLETGPEDATLRVRLPATRTY